MDKDEGLWSLRNKLYNAPIKESVVGLLRALPLAIAHAAAYINRRARMTVASCLNER